MHLIIYTVDWVAGNVTNEQTNQHMRTSEQCDRKQETVKSEDVDRDTVSLSFINLVLLFCFVFLISDTALNWGRDLTHINTNQQTKNLLKS